MALDVLLHFFLLVLRDAASEEHNILYCSKCGGLSERPDCFGVSWAVLGLVLSMHGRRISLLGLPALVSLPFLRG